MIQVLNRAIDIIEHLAHDPERPKHLGDIAQAVGLNLGTCANILKTMVNRRYVNQIGPRKGYCLGIRAYLLTGNTNYRIDILEMARPEIATLSRQVNESCLLAVLNGNQRLIIHNELCNQLIQVHTPNEKNVYDSASGRLLVSLMNDTDLIKFKERYGLPTPEFWEEATNEITFYNQVQIIRQRGYAFQETANQSVGYAVGIFRQNEVVAGLSVYLPFFRHKPENANNILRVLKAVAERISLGL